MHLNDLNTTTSNKNIASHLLNKLTKIVNNLKLYKKNMHNCYFSVVLLSTP